MTKSAMSLSTSTMSSFSIDNMPEFVKPLSSKYVCAECKQNLHPQVKQTACGHRFHTLCIEKLQEQTPPPQCPANEEDCVGVVLTDDNIYPDRGTDRELLNMHVFCTNKPRCDVTIKWRQLKEHTEECLFNQVSCPNSVYGCQAKFLLNDRDNHLETCQFTPVQCEFCGNKYAKATLEDHTQICRLEEDSCYFTTEGCTFKGTRLAVRQHEEANKDEHLKLTTKVARQNRELAEVLSQQVAVLARDQSNDTLQNDLNQVERGLREELVDVRSDVLSIKRRVETQHTEARDHVSTAAAAVPSTTFTQSPGEKGDYQVLLDRRISALEARAASSATGVGTSVSEDESKIIRANERMVGLHDVTLAEYEIRFRCLETANYNGVLLWKITSYANRKKAAQEGRTLSVYSQPFYTDTYGYKMCARVYLDGDGMGKGTHASLYFVVMKGKLLTPSIAAVI